MALPHRLGPIKQTEKNKVFSSLLSCLGKDLLKVVPHGSAVPSDYCSDITRFKRIKAAAEVCVHNAEELANCVFVQDVDVF